MGLLNLIAEDDSDYWWSWVIVAVGFFAVGFFAAGFWS